MILLTALDLVVSDLAPSSPMDCYMADKEGTEDINADHRFCHRALIFRNRIILAT